MGNSPQNQLYGVKFDAESIGAIPRSPFRSHRIDTTCTRPSSAQSVFRANGCNTRVASPIERAGLEEGRLPPEEWAAHACEFFPRKRAASPAAPSRPTIGAHGHVFPQRGRPQRACVRRISVTYVTYVTPVTSITSVTSVTAQRDTAYVSVAGVSAATRGSGPSRQLRFTRHLPSPPVPACSMC